MARLKAAGIARERTPGRYTLTDGYRAAYEEQLKHSGIVAAEKRQKKRHTEHRRKRAEALAREQRGEANDSDSSAETVKRSDANLKGPEAMQRTLAGMEPVYRRKRHEQERRKAARPYTDEERVRLLVRQGMAERFARREVYGEPGLDEPPLEDAS